VKAAIVVLAGTEMREGLGRVVNAMTVASEFAEHGDDVVVVFDGAGTTWIPELADPSHRYHELFESVRGSISGACDYCAAAYGVKDGVEAAGVALLDEYAQHPSLRKLAVGGYTIITF
jgi:hypothetical protein